MGVLFCDTDWADYGAIDVFCQMKPMHRLQSWVQCFCVKKELNLPPARTFQKLTFWGCAEGLEIPISSFPAELTNPGVETL